MGKVTFFVLLAVILMNCSCNETNKSNKTNKPANKNISGDSTQKVEQKISKDNFERESIFKDSVKLIGQAILNGDKIWKHEPYLEALMDSLTSNDSISRQFYFRVFNKICEQGDGWIGEYIGYCVLQYLESKPLELVENSKLISDNSFFSMGYQTGIEIYMNEEMNSDLYYIKLIKNTKEKTKSLSQANKLKLNSFFKHTKKGIDYMKTEN